MPIIVNTTAEINPLLERVRAAATRTAQALARLTAEEPDGLQVLRRLKFTEMARHPIDERPLNLVEQINQTWPYLVTLKALPILFERHPEAGGFRLKSRHRRRNRYREPVPERSGRRNLCRRASIKQREVDEGGVETRA